MKTPKRIVHLLAAFALVCGVSLTARAQVGSGWTSYSPSHTTQTVGSGSVSGTTFKITSTSTSTEQRAEFRYATISSGQGQMEGTVKVNSLGGDRISLSQIHKTTSATSLVAIKKPGTLYEVEGGATVGSLAIGASARINMTIDTATGTCVTYLNGSKKTTVNGGKGSYYFKVGVYRTNSGKGPISATWTNLKFWKK